MEDIDPRLEEAIKKVTGRRPRTVIDHILQHGSISTETLKEEYGYDHPPRAARDVREAGIPLETFWIRGSTGRKIGAYRFGDIDKIEGHKLAGRRTFSKELKQRLLEQEGSRCAICQTKYEGRYLQIDHRVPYEVSGDAGEADEGELMLLCASCQRSKSWTCEGCGNWTEQSNEFPCASCYWASPENHEHFAGEPIRRLDVSWVSEEMPEYNSLRETAAASGMTISELAKALIAKALGENPNSD